MNTDLIAVLHAHALRLQRDHATSGAVILPSVTVSDLIVTIERAARAIAAGLPKEGATTGALSA